MAIYATHPDDEEDLYAEYLGAHAMPANDPLPAEAAAATVALEQQAAPEMASGEDMYAQYLATREPANDVQPMPRSSYEAPPERKRGSQWQTWLAMALDLALNKGTGAPQYVASLAQGGEDPYENYMRREQAKDRASVRDLRSAQTMAKPAAAKNEALEYRKQQDAAKAAAESERRNKDSPLSVAARQRIYDVRPDLAGKFDSWTAYDIEENPATSVLIQRLKGDDKLEDWQTQFGERKSEARAMEDYRQGNRKEMVDYGAATQEKKTANERAYNERKANIVGWEREEGAPPLTEGSVNEAMGTATGLAELRASVGKIREIDAQLSAMERAGVLAGRETEETARLKEELHNAGDAIRKIANFGTPQAAELAITYSRLPQIDTLDAWRNGAVKYKALLDSMESRAAAKLKVMGYRPAGSGRPATQQQAPAEPRQPRVWAIDELQEVTP